MCFQGRARYLSLKKVKIAFLVLRIGVGIAPALINIFLPVSKTILVVVEVGANDTNFHLLMPLLSSCMLSQMQLSESHQINNLKAAVIYVAFFVLGRSTIRPKPCRDVYKHVPV